MEAAAGEALIDSGKFIFRTVAGAKANPPDFAYDVEEKQNQEDFLWKYI